MEINDFPLSEKLISQSAVSESAISERSLVLAAALLNATFNGERSTIESDHAGL
jgi:hypothetical protein